MSSPDTPSLTQPPPPPARRSHTSQTLRQHPLWMRAAQGAAGSVPAASQHAGRPSTVRNSDGATRFERISLLSVELQQSLDRDGADSTLLSNDEADDASAAASDDSDASCASDNSQGSGAAGRTRLPREARDKKRVRAERPPPQSAGCSMTEAAFGCRAAAPQTGELTDTESQTSRGSSKRARETYKRIFPVKGIRCVGCALTTRIGPVERFVNDNVGRMAESALWKMAALTWIRDVVEPARREGVHVVDWPWKDIANHFRLHTTNPVIGRTAMIQSLTAMRCQVEECLVRVEDGVRTLDKANADLFLKIVAADSRERQLLANSTQPATRGSRTHCPQRAAAADE